MLAIWVFNADGQSVNIPHFALTDALTAFARSQFFRGHITTRLIRDILSLMSLLILALSFLWQVSVLLWGQRRTLGGLYGVSQEIHLQLPLFFCVILYPFLARRNIIKWRSFFIFDGQSVPVFISPKSGIVKMTMWMNWFEGRIVKRHLFYVRVCCCGFRTFYHSIRILCFWLKKCRCLHFLQFNVYKVQKSKNELFMNRLSQKPIMFL